MLFFLNIKGPGLLCAIPAELRINKEFFINTKAICAKEFASEYTRIMRSMQMAVVFGMKRRILSAVYINILWRISKMNKIKILALIMVLVLSLSLMVSCGGDGIDLSDAVERTDFTSVYSKIGSKVTIDMVEEDANGIAYVTYEGTKYELGMDFLSMAMVYNTTVPANSAKYKTQEDVFNEWWKLYILRWNHLAPEVPLYSNIYYDLYNAKIENFATTPYWSPASAIVGANVKAGQANSVILGSATELSGAFRNSSWGKSSPGASDLDIEELTTGHATVMSDKNGTYVWNEYVVNGAPTATLNDDKTLTYTIKIKEGLKFSDGSAINAKNYIAELLVNSTPVGVAAGGSGNSGIVFVGFDAFKAYTGKDAEGASKYFEGVKLIDDYTFSVTLTQDYAGYYYSMTNASFAPSPLKLYLPGDADIVVDPTTKACGLNDAFYATELVNEVETYSLADDIVANLKWDSALPYSGPYTVVGWDEANLVATLKINPNYTGDSTRGKPSIETITYIKTVSETQMDMFKTGQVDIVAGITGGTETKAALDVVASDPSKYAETHYDRAGYGKLGFRADFGTTSFIEVRQAIMYTINRPEFAQTFTGGYGSVVHGPYYTGYSAYQANEAELEAKLNQYAYSADKALEVLKAGGWIYNAEGGEYTEGIRYKKLEGYDLTKDNLKFKSIDGKYKTVAVETEDGKKEYYMPLVINWYGTQPNDVTDQLVTAWQTSKTATESLGMYITYTSCDFTTGLYAEYLQDVSSGFDGTPKLNAINFATGFTSAAYDFAFNWTIDPEMYDVYSTCYLMDEADFWTTYHPAAE